MVKYIEICVFSVVLAAAFAAPANQECDKSKCKGPIKFYEDVSCKPIYEKEDDCCPSKYNCDHLKKKSLDKCYNKGREYNAGDDLQDEFLDPCKSCKCEEINGKAQWLCNSASCYAVNYVMARYRNGTRYDLDCYLPRDPFTCCPGQQQCADIFEVLPTCEVDGITYKLGKEFRPAGEPNKRCFCGEGYKGENVAPFCRTLDTSCNIEKDKLEVLLYNHAPIYTSSQSPQKDCPVGFRKPYDGDHVIKPDGTLVVASEEKSTSEGMMCKFGNLMLNVGEEINRGSWHYARMNCSCQVPPVVMCQEWPQ